MAAAEEVDKKTKVTTAFIQYGCLRNGWCFYFEYFYQNPKAQPLVYFVCSAVNAFLRKKLDFFGVFNSPKFCSCYTRWTMVCMQYKVLYYIDTNEIPGFFLSLKNSYLHRAQWRYYFYLSCVRILVSPWLLTWLASYKRASRSGARPVLLKFHQYK